MIAIISIFINIILLLYIFINKLKLNNNILKNKLKLNNFNNNINKLFKNNKINNYNNLKKYNKIKLNKKDEELFKISNK